MCSCSLFFSLPLIFTLVAAIAFSFSNLAIKFSYFSFISCSSSFSVIHVNGVDVECMYLRYESRTDDFVRTKIWLSKAVDKKKMKRKTISYGLERIVLYYAHVYHQTSFHSFFCQK